MAVITSTASGDWSVGATWVGGVAPVLGDSVIIASGHTVTVDGVYRVGDDTATAVQVNGGTLKFSRTVNSGLSVRGGVRNGTTAGSVWDMGTVADPIPSGVTCTLLLNDSATLASNKYDFDWGRTNNVAGQFHANGVSKTAATLTTSAASASSTSLEVADATGWAVGDRIGMHGDAPNMASQRESRFVSAISGSGPYTLTLNTGLTNAHASGTRVVNLTRNVRVGCYSSTVQNGRFYVRVTSSFSCNWVEWSHGWGSAFEGGFSLVLSALSVAARGTMTGLAFHDYTFAAAPGATQTSSTFQGLRFLGGDDGLNLDSSVFFLGTASAGAIGGATGGNSGGTLSRIYVMGGASGLSATLSGRWAGFQCNDSEFYCITNVTNDSGNAMDGTFQRCKMFCQTGASQATGHNVTLSACEFLAPASGYTAIFRAAGYSNATYRSPTLDANVLALGDSLVNTPVNLTGGVVKFTGVNGDATDSRLWNRAGLAESSAALVRASPKNFRMRPGASSTLSTVPFVYSFSFSVASGVSYTLIPYMQADATYGTAIAPTISYAAPGVSVTDSMPANTGTWNKMLRTITPTASGICTVTVTCQGSAGSVYFDGVPDAEFVRKARHYGYVLDNLTPYVIADPFITVTNEATVGAYTGISINDGTQEVTVTSAHTTAELYDYCKWSRCQSGNLSQPDFFTTTDGETYTSTYTIILSGAGAVTGIYTDPGGTRAPITAPNLPIGTRVQFYNDTDNVELTNEVLSGAGASTSLYFTGSKTIRLRASKLGSLPIEAFGSMTASGLTFIDEFVTDDVYVAKGIDGSTVTEFSADEPNVQIDSDDPDGTSSVWRCYAWFRYYETSSIGVAGVLFGAATAIDTENLAIDSDRADIQLDNVSAVPLKISDGYMYRTDGATIIAPTSGSIQMDPKKAYGVDGLLSGEIEPGFDLARTLRIIAAAVAGKTTGGPAGFTARNLGDTTDQVTGTATEDGNRTPTSYGS